MKIDLEKFDGRINFGLCKIQFEDVFIQLGLHKALKGNISKMDKEKGDELALRALIIIRKSFTKNILVNVLSMLSSKELWENL